jgi:hypothetical protein
MPRIDRHVPRRACGRLRPFSQRPSWSPLIRGPERPRGPRHPTWCWAPLARGLSTVREDMDPGRHRLGRTSRDLGRASPGGSRARRSLVCGVRGTPWFDVAGGWLVIGLAVQLAHARERTGRFGGRQLPVQDPSHRSAGCYVRRRVVAGLGPAHRDRQATQDGRSGGSELSPGPVRNST